MSSNATATLCYGFIVPPEFYAKDISPIEAVTNDRKGPYMVFHGSSEPDVLIAAHKIEVWDCETVLNVNEKDLEYLDEWDNRLDQIRKKLKLPKQTYRWYLTSSYT